MTTIKTMNQETPEKRHTVVVRSMSMFLRQKSMLIFLAALLTLCHCRWVRSGSRQFMFSSAGQDRHCPLPFHPPTYLSSESNLVKCMATLETRMDRSVDRSIDRSPQLWIWWLSCKMVASTGSAKCNALQLYKTCSSLARSLAGSTLPCLSFLSWWVIMKKKLSNMAKLASTLLYPENFLVAFFLPSFCSCY